MEELYVLKDLEKDEFEVAIKAIEELQQKKEKERLLAINNTKMRILVQECIRSIGLDETKRLVREINRDLRSLQEEDAY